MEGTVRIDFMVTRKLKMKESNWVIETISWNQYKVIGKNY